MHQTKKTAYRAMLIACAFALSWLEVQLPTFFPIPGMKLGLANLAVMIALYSLGDKDAFMMSLLRIFLVGITFGNTFSMIYSLAGGLLSFLCMYLLKKSNHFNMVAVSVCGGIMHNVGQIIVAVIFMSSTKILYYLPFLWLSGIGAGGAIGYLSSLVLKRLPETLTGGHDEK